MARIVDRVGVAVLPDTSKFVAELKAFIARVENTVEIEIPTVLDLDGVQRGLAQIRSVVAGTRLQIPITTDVDTADLTASVRAAARAAEAATGAVEVQMEADEGTLIADARAAARQASVAVPDIEVDMDVDAAMLRARAFAAAAAVNPPPIEVDMDVDAAGAQGKLATVLMGMQARARANPVNVPVDVDRSSVDRLQGALGNLRFPNLSAQAAGFAALGAAIAAVTPHVLSLAGDLASTVGILALLPALISASAGAIGALVLGFRGFGDALKNMDDPAAFAEALERLAPSARDAADAVRQVAPAWGEMQQAVQQELFLGIADAIEIVSVDALPDLQRGLVATAGAFNAFAVSLAEAIAEQGRMGNFSVVFEAGAAALRNLSAAVGPVVRGLGEIARAGASMLPGFTAGAEGAARAFERWATQAARTGQITEWIGRAAEVFRALGSIIASVVTILGGFVSAAQAAGGITVDGLAASLQRVAAAVQSAPFQTGLTNFFRGIITGTQQAVAVLAQFGPSFRAVGQVAATAFTGAAAALTAFAPSINTVVTGLAGGLQPVLEAVSGLLTRLAGAVAPLAPAFAALAQSVGAGLGAAIASVAGPLTQIVGVLVGALAPVLPMIGAAFEALATAVGGALGPALDALAPIVQQVAQWLADRLGAVLPVLVPAVVALAQAVGARLAAAFNLLSAVLGPILGLLGPIVDFLGTALATAVQVAAVAIQFFADLLNQVATGIETFGLIVSASWDMLVTATQAAWDAISQGVSDAWTAVQDAVTVGMDVVQTIFTAGWELITTAVQVAWTAIQTVVTAGMTLISTIVQTGWTLIQTVTTTVWTAIQTVITVVWTAIQTAVQTALTFIRTIVTTVMTAIRTFIETAWRAVQTVTETVWQAIRTVVETAMRAVRTVIETAMATIQRVIQAAWDRAKQIVTDAWEAIKRAVTDGAAAVVRICSELVGRIVAAFAALPGRMLEVGRNAMEALGRGIADAGQAALAKAREIAGGIADAVSGFFKIGSPSRLFRQYGGWLMEGLEQGIDWRSSLPIATARKVAVSVSREFDPELPAYPRIGRFDVGDTLGADQGTRAGGGVQVVFNGNVGWDPDRVSARIAARQADELALAGLTGGW